MSNIQWIVVDDTDPRISYSGTWFTHGQETLKDMGQFGAPLLLTSHGTTINSSLSFSFSGTQLVVAGSQLVPVDLNSFGGTCTVDGVTQPIIYTTHNATNRVALCRYENLTDSHHTLVLDAVPAGRKPFWFDYLRYLPTPDVSTTNEYVEVLTDNDSIFFDDSWHNQAPENVIQASTNTTNAVMSYTFVGTSVTWFGSYNHSTFLHPANLSYTIDQEDPTIIQILPSTKARDDITMEQVIFNASGLSPGITHDLKVTYLGNPQSVPLSLNNLVITWGPLLAFGHDSSGATPSISGVAIPPLQTNSPANPSSVSNHKNPRILKIAMAGSIVGIAIVLGSIILLVIARRRQRRGSSPKIIEMVQDVSPRPFPVVNTIHSRNLKTNRRNSAPAAFVPSSKAQVPQAPHSLPPSSPTETAAPSTSGLEVSPTDREAATYLWNLLLRHQRTLSMQPLQHHEEFAGPSNSSRAQSNSPYPPAYDM